MKKLVLTMLVLSTLVCSMAVFAETAKTEYIVQSVTGKVEFEVSAGVWKAVTEGSKLPSTAVINTGINSKLIVKIDSRSVTIKPLQKGTLEELIAKNSASAASGITIGAKATESTVTADSGTKRTNISTASTRASQATEDIIFEVDDK
jgi:hypothetical protein